MLIHFWSDDTINFVVWSKRAQRILNVIRGKMEPTKREKNDDDSSERKTLAKADTKKREKKLWTETTDESINWKKIWMITRVASA